MPYSFHASSRVHLWLHSLLLGSLSLGSSPPAFSPASALSFVLVIIAVLLLARLSRASRGLHRIATGAGCAPESTLVIVQPSLLCVLSAGTYYRDWIDTFKSRRNLRTSNPSKTLPPSSFACLPTKPATLDLCFSPLQQSPTDRRRAFTRQLEKLSPYRHLSPFDPLSPARSIALEHDKRTALKQRRPHS